MLLTKALARRLSFSSGLSEFRRLVSWLVSQSAGHCQPYVNPRITLVLGLADEAGYVFLRQPPASKLANLCRINVRDHALGLVTQQLGGRVTEHPPGGWLGPRTPSLREGPGSASVPSGSPDPAAGTGARVLANEPSQLSPESTSYEGRWGPTTFPGPQKVGGPLGSEKSPHLGVRSSGTGQK